MFEENVGVGAEEIVANQEYVAYTGDGDDVIFLTAPTTDPYSNFIEIVDGTDDDAVHLFVEEFVTI